MNKNSAKDIAKWFFDNNNSVHARSFDANAKLQKMLFYAQAMHLAVHGESLFDEEVEAWPNGPVIREVYSYKKYNYIEETKESDLSKPVLQVLNVVNSVYGTLTGEELIETTHTEDPWLSRKDEITPKNNPIIPNKEIKAYYSPLKDLYEDFKNYDFASEILESIGGNNFTYNEKDTKLTDQDVEELFKLSQNINPETNRYIKNETFYVYKEDDGSLVVY